MTIALYMDHHVPEAIANGLRRLEVDVLVAWADDHARAEDEALLARAGVLGRVLFTQDDDLLAIAAKWAASGRSFAGLIFGHQLRVTIGQAVADLSLMAAVMEPEEMKDQVVFLPL